MKPTSDMNSLLPAGTVFVKYTVQKKLGQGGMGSVYLVKHNLLDALFALKTLHPEMSAAQIQSRVRSLCATEISAPDVSAAVPRETG